MYISKFHICKSNSFMLLQEAEECLDALRPELSPFCNYVRNYILSLSTDDDELNGEFIAKGAHRSIPLNFITDIFSTIFIFLSTNLSA